MTPASAPALAADFPDLPPPQRRSRDGLLGIVIDRGLIVILISVGIWVGVTNAKSDTLAAKVEAAAVAQTATQQQVNELRTNVAVLTATLNRIAEDQRRAADALEALQRRETR